MPKPLDLLKASSAGLAAAAALAAAGTAFLGTWPLPASATEVQTEQMIEALMPQATRSLRNLVVRQKPDATAGSASAAGPAVAVLPSPAAVAPASAAAPAPAAPGPAPSLALAIQFEPNSARVRPESGALLGRLVAALMSPELKGSRFIIEGHADARGAADRNLRLSQERADEVRLYLVALGVQASRLRAVGKGASQLADATDPGAAINRRVRVVTVE